MRRRPRSALGPCTTPPPRPSDKWVATARMRASSARWLPAAPRRLMALSRSSGSAGCSRARAASDQPRRRPPAPPGQYAPAPGRPTWPPAARGQSPQKPVAGCGVPRGRVSSRTLPARGSPSGRAYPGRGPRPRAPSASLVNGKKNAKAAYRAWTRSESAAAAASKAPSRSAARRTPRCPILCATLLSDGESLLRNVPDAARHRHHRGAAPLPRARASTSTRPRCASPPAATCGPRRRTSS